MCCSYSSSALLNSEICQHVLRTVVPELGRVFQMWFHECWVRGWSLPLTLCLPFCWMLRWYQWSAELQGHAANSCSVCCLPEALCPFLQSCYLAGWFLADIVAQVEVQDLAVGLLSFRVFADLFFQLIQVALKGIQLSTSHSNLCHLWNSLNMACDLWQLHLEPLIAWCWQFYLFSVLSVSPQYVFKGM